MKCSATACAKEGEATPTLPNHRSPLNRRSNSRHMARNCRAITRSALRSSRMMRATPCSSVSQFARRRVFENRVRRIGPISNRLCVGPARGAAASAPTELDEYTAGVYRGRGRTGGRASGTATPRDRPPDADPAGRRAESIDRPGHSGASGMAAATARVTAARWSHLPRRA